MKYFQFHNKLYLGSCWVICDFYAEKHCRLLLLRVDSQDHCHQLYMCDTVVYNRKFLKQEIMVNEVTVLSSVIILNSKIFTVIKRYQDINPPYIPPAKNPPCQNPPRQISLKG